MGGPVFDTRATALKIRQRRTQLVQGSLEQAQRFDPDTIAPNAELAAKSNMDLDFVNDNPQKAKDFLEFQQFTPTQADVLVNKYPDLAVRFMNDEGFAAVGQDEVDVLGGAENIFFGRNSDIRKGGQRSIKNANLALEGFRNYQKVLNGQKLTDQDYEMMELRQKDAQSIQLPDRPGVGGFIAEIPGVVAEQGLNMALVLTTRMGGTLLGGIAGAAFGARGGPATAAGGAIVGAAAGTFIAAGSIEAAYAFQDFATRTDAQGNRMDPELAAVGATAVFFINGAMETFGLNLILKTLPKGLSPGRFISQRVGKILGDPKRFAVMSKAVDEMKGGSAPAMTRLLKAVFGEAGTEGGQETASEITGKIIESLDDEAFVDSSLRDLVESEFWREAIPQIAESTKVGAQAGAGFSIPGTAVSVGRNIARPLLRAPLVSEMKAGDAAALFVEGALRTTGLSRIFEAAPKEVSLRPFITQTIKKIQRDPKQLKILTKAVDEIREGSSQSIVPLLKVVFGEIEALDDEAFVNSLLEEFEQFEFFTQAGEVANDTNAQDIADISALRQETDDAAQTTEDQRIIDELESLVAQAKMTERSPDMLASHLQTVSGEGNEFIRVDSKAIQEVIAESPQKLDTLRTVAPDIDTQLQDAERQGGADIVFPIGPYSTRIMTTPLHKEMRDDVKVTDGANSRREQEVMNRDIEAQARNVVEKQNKAVESQRDIQKTFRELKKEYAKNLKAKNPEMDNRTLNANAAVTAQMISVAAQKAGMTVREFEQQLGFDIAALEQIGKDTFLLDGKKVRNIKALKQTETPSDEILINAEIADIESFIQRGEESNRALEERVLTPEEVAIVRKAGDKATPEIQALEEKHGAESEQAQVIFGTHPDFVDTSRAQSILDARQEVRVTDAEAPTAEERQALTDDIANTVSSAISKLPTKLDDKKTLSEDELAAVAQLKEAERSVRALGADVQAFTDDVIQRFRSRFSDHADADFMINTVFGEQAARRALRQEDKGPIKGIFFPTSQGRSIIGLTKHADHSTFLHEMGHWYLHTLNELLKLPNPPAQFQEDMDTILGFLGAENYDGLTTEMQEKFTDTWLKYIMDGKAPAGNKSMKKVFDNFRAWLVALFQSGRLQQISDVEIPDDMIEVFNHMVATEAEIAQARNDMGAKPVFQTAEEAGMTPKQWESYQENVERMVAEGTRERDAEAVRLAQKKKTPEFTKKLKEETAKVQKEIDQTPAWKAKQFLMNGFSENPDLPHRLDHDSTIEILDRMPQGKELKRKFPRGKKKITTKGEDGLNPEIVASQFDFASAEAMLNEILVVTNNSAKTIAEGNLREQGIDGTRTRTEKAQDALDNKHFENKLLAEIEAAEKLTGTRKSNPQLLKASVADIVRRLKVRELKPDTYVREMNRQAGLALSEAQKKNPDLEKVAEHSRRQLTNLYLYRAARDQKEQVRVWRDDLKRLGKAKTRKSVPDPYLQQIDAILTKFPWRVGTPKVAPEELPIRIKAFQDLQNNLGHFVDVNDDFIDATPAKSLNAMTVAEAQMIYESVKNLEVTGRATWEVFLQGKKRGIRGMADRIIRTLQEKSGLPVRKPTSESQKSLFAMVTRPLINFHMDNRIVPEQMFVADGNKEGGENNKIMVKTTNVALETEEIQLEIASNKILDIMGEHMQPKNLAERFEILDEQGDPTGVSVKKESLLAMGLNRGNKNNLDRLIQTANRGTISEGFGPQHLGRAFELITDEEYASIQEVWDYFDTFRPALEKLNLRTKGRIPKWVKGVPFTVRDVTYDGGYYPIAYDRSLSEQGDKLEAEKPKGQNSWITVQTNQDFLKERAEEGVKDLSLKMEVAPVISRHINDVIHDLVFRELIMMFNSLLKPQMAGAAYKAHLGEAGFENVKQWVAALSNSSYIAEKRTEYAPEFFRGINKVATFGALTYKVSTSLLQPLGLTQSANVVGVAPILRATVKYMQDWAIFEDGRPRLWKTVEEIYKKSNFMRTRGPNMDREVRQQLKSLTGSTAVQQFEATGFLFIQKMQMLTDVITWEAAYEKAIKQEPFNEDRAEGIADDVVRRTQGSGLKPHLPRILSQNTAMGRSFTLFMTFFNAVYNNWANDIARAVYKQDPHGYAKLVSSVLLLNVIPGIASAYVVGFGPEEDESIPEWLIKNQLGYLTGMLPFVRDVGALFEFGPSGGGGSVGSFLRDIYDFGTQAEQGEIDVAFGKATIDVINVIFTAIPGLPSIPAGQLKASFEGGVQAATGELEDIRGLLLRGFQER